MVEETKQKQPVNYSRAVRDEICTRLAQGETLRSICRDNHMPARQTVNYWNIHNIGEEKIGDEVIEEGFYYHYTRARNIGLDNMADEIIEISDDGSNDWMERDLDNGKTVTVANHEHIARSRLRSDNRKWYLAKMYPKRYGEASIIRTQMLDKDENPTDQAAQAKEIVDQVLSKAIAAFEKGMTEAGSVGKKEDR